MDYLLRAGWKPPPVHDVIVNAITRDLERLNKGQALHQPRDRMRHQPGAPEPLLTPVQARILQLVAEGNENDEIAVILERAPQTVKFHLTAIYERLNARGRAHAVAIAISLDEIVGLEP